MHKRVGDEFTYMDSVVNSQSICASDTVKIEIEVNDFSR